MSGKPVQAGSRFSFTLLTDHQPLSPILNSMGLTDVENARLQRLMMLPYFFTVKWVKGKDHLVANARSLSLSCEPTVT